MKHKKVAKVKRTVTTRPCIYLVCSPTEGVGSPDLKPITSPYNRNAEYYFNLVTDYRRRDQRSSDTMPFLDVNGEPRGFILDTKDILYLSECGYHSYGLEFSRLKRITFIEKLLVYWESLLSDEMNTHSRYLNSLIRLSKPRRERLNNRVRLTPEYYHDQLSVCEKRIERMRYAIEKLYEWKAKLKKGYPVPKIGCSDKLIG